MKTEEFELCTLFSFFSRLGRDRPPAAFKLSRLTTILHGLTGSTSPALISSDYQDQGWWSDSLDTDVSGRLGEIAVADCL